MEIGKVIKPEIQGQIQPQQARQALSSDELKRLSDLFSILIQIDQKNKSKVKKNDNI